MTPRPSLYAAFLYGVNIPGGRHLSKLDVMSVLESLQPDTTFCAIVGRPDSVVVSSTEQSTEERVRIAVSGALDCACVVLSATALDAIVASALDVARRELHCVRPPYRIRYGGVEWELCTVLSADTLPPDTSRNGWLFRPTANAAAIVTLERRALLVRKRRLTARGTRVMLGDALNNPWRGTLETQGLVVGCLTSRTLNRLVEVKCSLDSLRVAHQPQAAEPPGEG